MTSTARILLSRASQRGFFVREGRIHWLWNCEAATCVTFNSTTEVSAMKKQLVFGVLGLGLVLLAGCGGGGYYASGGYTSVHRTRSHVHYAPPVRHHTVIHRHYSRPPVCRY